MHGPTVPFSQEMHAEKYRAKGENFEDAMNRVANGLSDNVEHFNAFRDILMDMRFLPGGRIQSSIGSTKNTTPYNCYVSGTIEDSFVEGHGSIMSRATEAAATMRMGGGIGYDFSTLRPDKALIKKLMSYSSGPISFMGIFNSVCLTVSSSGHRRGAQMAVLRIDHPDIEAFIHCKQNSDALTGFNISIAVTDEFMECYDLGKPFPLRFNGEVYREIDPVALWDQIMRSTWDWAEPGVLFIDQINRMNNLWYCEKIAATNPCGEQPLPPYGACLLGSINVTRYVGIDDYHNVATIDINQMCEDMRHVVRAMDNVVDKAIYPLYEQEKEAKNKRRMGLGITGLANAMEALGYAYGSRDFLEMQDKVMSALNEEAYMTSVLLAREKGSFPMFDPKLYGQSNFVKGLNEDLQDDIRAYGIRNSHLTSIAPTGTISLCADNISSGIEPVFSYEFDRIVKSADGTRTESVKDYGVRHFQVQGKRTKDVSLQEHLAVLTVASRNVDSAVSKTCNVGSDVTWDDFKDVYRQAWLNGCKGITTFRDAGKREGILKATDEDENDVQACFYNPETGQREGCEA